MQCTIQKLEKTSVLVVRGINVIKCAKKFSVLDHATFPRFRNTVDDTLHLKAISPAPVFLPSLDTSKLESHYIPQLMQGMIHAHSRLILLGHIVIGVSNDRAYYMDLSGAALLTGDQDLLEGELTLLNAPETHLYKKISPQSDYYGLGMWWYHAGLGQDIDNSRDFLETQKLASSSAAGVKKTMLSFEPHKRTDMEFLLSRHVESTRATLDQVSPSSLHKSIQKAMVENDFEDLSKNINAENMPTIKLLMPHLLVNISQRTINLRGKYAEVHQDNTKFALLFLNNMQNSDKNFLDEVTSSATKRLENFFLLAIGEDSTVAVKVILALVGVKLFSVTKQFLLSVCKLGLYKSELIAIAEACEDSTARAFFKTFVADYESLAQKSTEELSDARAKLTKLSSFADEIKAILDTKVRDLH